MTLSPSALLDWWAIIIHPLPCLAGSEFTCNNTSACIAPVRVH